MAACSEHMGEADLSTPLVAGHSAAAGPAKPTAWRQALFALPVAMLSGFVLGAAGVGAGIILITGLANIPQIGLTQLAAIGTSCPAQLFCTATSGIAWVLLGDADFGAAACLGLPGLGGTVLGLHLATKFNDGVLRLCFGGILLVLGVVTLRRALMGGDVSEPPPIAVAGDFSQILDQLWQKANDDCARALEQPLLAVLHCIVGSFVGILAGMLATGDTPMIIAYMTSLNYTQKQAIGTALMATFPMYILVTFMHVRKGNVTWAVVPVSIAGMTVCGVVGAHFSSKDLSDFQLQLGFAVFLVCIGAPLVRKAMLEHALRQDIAQAHYTVASA